jgi:hypothetical protein
LIIVGSCAIGSTGAATAATAKGMAEDAITSSSTAKTRRHPVPMPWMIVDVAAPAKRFPLSVPRRCVSGNRQLRHRPRSTWPVTVRSHSDPLGGSVSGSIKRLLYEMIARKLHGGRGPGGYGRPGPRGVHRQYKHHGHYRYHGHYGHHGHYRRRRG